MDDPLETTLNQLVARFPKVQGSLSANKCHFCGHRKLVLGCFPPSGCSHAFCENCLKSHFNEDVQAVLEQRESWTCPVKRGKCGCASCAVRSLRIHCFERKEDLVQSALDYNAYLLEYLNTNRNKISQEDLDYARKMLIDNFKNLAKLADYQKRQERRNNANAN